MLQFTRLLLALILSVQITASAHAAEHMLDPDHQETCVYSLHAYEPLAGGYEIDKPVFLISYIALSEPQLIQHYISHRDKGLHNRGPPASP